MQDLIDQASMTEVERQVILTKEQAIDQAKSQQYEEWLDWFNHSYTKNLINSLIKQNANLSKDIATLSITEGTDLKIRYLAMSIRYNELLLKNLTTSPLTTNSAK